MIGSLPITHQHRRRPWFPLGQYARSTDLSDRAVRQHASHAIPLSVACLGFCPTACMAPLIWSVKHHTKVRARAHRVRFKTSAPMWLVGSHSSRILFLPRQDKRCQSIDQTTANGRQLPEVGSLTGPMEMMNTHWLDRNKGSPELTHTTHTTRTDTER